MAFTFYLVFYTTAAEEFFSRFEVLLMSCLVTTLPSLNC